MHRSVGFTLASLLNQGVITMSNDLKTLNENTFTSEAQGGIDGVDWDRFLRRTLSDDFRIRRSNPKIPLQERDGMIAHIRKDNNPVKRHLSNVVVFEDGDYGVVTSIVTLEGQTDRFHNIKAFSRQPSGDWQCVYWQVSKPHALSGSKKPLQE